MISQQRILLVEDEESLQKLIQLNLEMEGYEVLSTGNGREAYELANQQYFDLLILDIMLPELNGIDLCEKIRLKNQQVGIIFISAKSELEDIITGLKKGGDDYLVKPFHLEELLVRVERVLQRTRSQNNTSGPSQFKFGENEVFFDKYEANTSKGMIKLSQKELLLLKLLIERKNEVVSRKDILKVVWEYDVIPSTRTIDNFILSFRKYFEKDPKNPIFFKSIRSVGYQFKMDN